MKNLLKPAFALLLLYCESQGQSYKLLSETRFALRINFNNPTKPQQPRVAGADHMVTKPSQETIGLNLNEGDGMVVIDDKKHTLSAVDINRLRQGSPILLAKELEIYLTSDAQDRSRAMLIVRSATSLDMPILYLLELELTPD